MSARPHGTSLATSTICASGEAVVTGHGPRAVLVGPPGAGKTVVGQRLADRWGVRFRDTDVDIEQSTGRSISDLFVEQGEEHFRILERQAVATALSEHEGVLASGEGPS